MRSQQPDEGGPWSYAPVFTDGYNRDRWLQLLRLASDDGTPIELAPDRAQCTAPAGPPPDYCEYGLLENCMMIFSARAAAALRHQLIPACQEIPVRCPGHDVAAFRVRAVEDVLDAARSDAAWIGVTPRRFASHFRSFSFFTDRLGPTPIFMLPQYTRTFVLQSFVDIVRANGFTGFVLAKVWPSSPLGIAE